MMLVASSADQRGVARVRKKVGMHVSVQRCLIDVADIPIGVGSG